MWPTRFPQLRHELDAERIQRAWDDDSELLLSFVAGPIHGRAFVTGDVLNLLPALTNDATSFSTSPDYHDLSEFFETTEAADAFVAIAEGEPDFAVVGKIADVDPFGQHIDVMAIGLPFPLDARRVPPLAKRLAPGVRVAFRVKGLQLWL
jgi:hypothetical protein